MPSQDPAQDETQATDTPKKVDWKKEARAYLIIFFFIFVLNSFIGKRFYIPSESMLPTLYVGDNLVVSKYAYGYSFTSPTLPDPIAILRHPFLSAEDKENNSWLVHFPFMQGRLFGSLPARGDIVVPEHPERRVDYIKRMIGLPGDTLEMHNGLLYINGKPVRREERPALMLPVDVNSKCPESEYPGARVTGADGKLYCRLPIMHEWLPNGANYDTVVFNDRPDAENWGPVTIHDGHVWLMGDNRDRSADSRFPMALGGLGGELPVEYLSGRAEFITHSYDGSGSFLNPISWFSTLRSGRYFSSLRPNIESK
jgi:signal peptidase I